MAVDPDEPALFPRVAVENQWKVCLPRKLLEGEASVILSASFCSGIPLVRYAANRQPFEINWPDMTLTDLRSKKKHPVELPDASGLEEPSKPLIPPGEAFLFYAPAGSSGRTLGLKKSDEAKLTRPYHVRVPPEASPDEGTWLLVPVPKNTSLPETGDLTVKVQSLEGSLLNTCACLLSETVSQLKARLADGVQSQLFYDGNALKDEDTVAMCGFQDGDSLILVILNVLTIVPPQLGILSTKILEQNGLWNEAAEVLDAVIIQLPGHEMVEADPEDDLECDIGTFGQHSSSVGLQLLEGCHESIPEVLRQLSGDGEATFLHHSEPVLREHTCGELIALLNRKHKGQRDLQVRLSQLELRELIGEAQLMLLQELFREQVDQIKLRRVEAHGELINLHLDHSKKTMQVALNGDHEYVGGRLAYVTSKGLTIPSRTRGCATVHDNRIVHGVTRLESGVRYSLFLQQLI